MIAPSEIYSPFNTGKIWKVGPRLYQTMKRITYFSYIEGHKTKLVVPKDFLSDLGTIPRVLWPFVAPDDYLQAFILHDYLYFTRVFLRKTADDLFFEMLVSSSCPKHRALIIFYLVRLFGGRCYKKKIVLR